MVFSLLTLQQPNKLVKFVTLEDAVQETYDMKVEKIRFSKNRKKIIQLEQQYIEYYFNKTLSIDELLCEPEDDNFSIYEMINIIDYAFYNKNKNYSRLSIDDFLSVSYEKAWKTVLEYNYQSNYWLYHHLQKNIKHSCIDVLRKEGLTKDRTNSHTSFHKSAYLEPYNDVDTFNLEDNIILQDSLKEVAQILTSEEMNVYNVFLNADNVEKVTLDDICKELNLKHRQQAKRILDKVREKLSILK